MSLQLLDAIRSELRSAKLCPTDHWLRSIIARLATNNNRLDAIAAAKQLYLNSHIASTSSAWLDASALLQRKHTIKDSGVVQLVSARNISQSAYRQLNDLAESDSVRSANLAVDADADGESWSEKQLPKGKRMLLLTLTDGSTTLKAIEFDPLDELSVDTKPGSKLLLQPPILCRSSIAFLRKRNVHLLGGAAPATDSKNSRRNVLRRALGMEEIAEEEAANAETGAAQNAAATVTRQSTAIPATSPAQMPLSNRVAGNHAAEPQNPVAAVDDDESWMLDVLDAVDDDSISEVKSLGAAATARNPCQTTGRKRKSEDDIVCLS